jgi:dihydrolipoamide dehydrogenase
MSDSTSEERPHTGEEPPHQSGQARLERTYDVVVIGGGAVGENVAARVVQRGLSALLIEEELLGGECSYWACMPSKALLRAGEVLRAARAVPGAAQAVTGDLDVRAVLERRDAFTSHWDDSAQVRWAERTGIPFVRGHGRLDGPRRVVVRPVGDTTEQQVEARHAVVVCSGARDPALDQPGGDERQGGTQATGRRRWRSRGV